MRLKVEGVGSGKGGRNGKGVRVEWVEGGKGGRDGKGVFFYDITMRKRRGEA